MKLNAPRPSTPTSMKMKTLTFVCLSTLALILGCNIPEPSNSSPHPNIVLILSDDQAWHDYSFMEHDIAYTPHIDKLAAESVVFERGYVPTAICRPSLMTLVTGLYPHQHKITGNDPKGGYKEATYPREELLANIDSLPALPRLLTQQGYLTHQSGKWWEGHHSRGGFTHGMTQGRRHGDEGLKIGREGMEPIYEFVNYAEAEEKPFFLWYAPFLPHTPHNPPDRLLDKYKNLEGLTLQQAKYYAMVEWFDETCGQLINFLEEKELRENTLIYYICDNGWIQRPDKNGFDFGSKQSPMEGGVRTPIMFSWKGKISPKHRPEFISSIDLYPTILEIADIEIPEDLPGRSLWSALKSGDPLEQRVIYGEGFGHNMIEKDNPTASLAYRWCIEGDWKLILCYDGSIEGYRVDSHAYMRQEPIRLYNVVEDPDEQVNLVAQHPKIVERLQQRLEGWYPVGERQVYGMK